MTLPVLVTGHTGFLGRALTPMLDAAGIAWMGASSRAGLDLEAADTPDRLPPARAIVHLAGRVGVPRAWHDPYGAHRSNFLSTLAVMEHARRCAAPVVLMGSYVYGVPQSLPVAEDHPLAAVNPYGWSKLESELVAQAYAADFAVPVTVLRLFGVYGPGQDADQLIPTICRQALAGGPVSLADPRPRRDFLWVEDVAAAVLAVLAAPAAPGFAAYNLGSGASVAVAEVVEAVLRHAGPCRVEWRNQFRPNEVLDCIADARRFRAVFNWEPRVTLDEGIRRMLAWEKEAACA